MPDSLAISPPRTHEDDDVQLFMVTKSQPDSVLNDEKERLIKPREAIIHLQFALFWYSDGPSDIVPELVPLDGWHRQPPEHVTVAAVTDWYLPASHAVHGPPFGPGEPALQVQLDKDMLPAGELEFDGQSVHEPSTIQEATKPDEATLPSDVNLTCMYPVLDV
jgi:hypothetical protein